MFFFKETVIMKMLYSTVLLLSFAFHNIAQAVNNCTGALSPASKIESETSRNFELVSSSNGVYETLLGSDKFPVVLDTNQGVIRLGANEESVFIANKEVHVPFAEGDGLKRITYSVVRPGPYYDTEVNVYKVMLRENADGSREVVDVKRMSVFVELW